MELITRVSGTLKLNNAMAEVIKYGVMEAYMKDIGRVIRQMVVVDSSMQTVTFMMVTGKMIKLMGSVSTLTLMVLSMKDIGLTISSMAKARSTGQMARNMKATISMERKMVMVSSCGLTDLVIVESLSTIIFMEKVPTDGLTVVCMKGTGEQIKCTAKDLSSGKMVENMLASTVTTRKRVMENSAGRMADAIGASGQTVDKTEKEPTSPAKARKNMASGKMAKGSDGSVAVRRTETKNQ